MASAKLTRPFHIPSLFKPNPSKGVLSLPNRFLAASGLQRHRRGTFHLFSQTPSARDATTHTSHTYTRPGRRHLPSNCFPRLYSSDGEKKSRKKRRRGRKRCQLFPLGFVPCVFSPRYYPFVHLTSFLPALPPPPPPPPPTPVRFVILHLLWPLLNSPPSRLLWLRRLLSGA